MLISVVAEPTYIPTDGVQWCPFLQPHGYLSCLVFFDHSNSNKPEVMSHGSDSLFPNDL